MITSSALLSRYGRRRRGMTMLELLVVVTIMLMMVVIALPKMMPSKEGRRLREAARSLNMFFGAARSRAMELNRPRGVWMERLATNPRACNVLFEAEVPPLYCGDTLTTTVTVQASSGTVVAGVNYFSVAQGAGVLTTVGNVFPGDTVQFNFTGPLYTVSAAASGGNPGNKTGTDGSVSSLPLVVQLDTTIQAVTTPWTTTASSPVPFKMWRRPRKIASTRLSLPPGTVIDLQFSGDDAWLEQTAIPVDKASGSGRPIYGEFDQNRMITPANVAYEQPVVILFSPAGNVDSIYCWQGLPNPASNPPVYGVAGTAGAAPVNGIFLLLGQESQLQAPLYQPANNQIPVVEDQPNWLNSNSLWLTIWPQAGVVKVSENRPLNPSNTLTAADNNAYQALITAGGLANWIYTSRANWQQAILLSRTYARGAEGLGGQ